jgi:hypothetical protein
MQVSLSLALNAVDFRVHRRGKILWSFALGGSVASGPLLATTCSMRSNQRRLYALRG